MRRFALALLVVMSTQARTVAFADTLIPFDTPESAALFAHSPGDADAGAYSLLRYYETQEDRAYCGVASSAMVLNSLGVDAPVTPHLFPDRLFDQSNLFTDKVLAIKSPKMVAVRGLQLEQLGAILSAFALKVDVLHAKEMKKPERFRELAVAALSDPKSRVIVNYSRQALGQTGYGHISPLAAYDAGSDRFLILDVARYRLPPVWVTTKDLFAAMNTKDKDAGKTRGMVIARKP